MASVALSAKITALRESLSPETAACVTSVAEMRADRKVPPLPTRIEGLDRLLSGGLSRGKLIEIVGGRSTGRFAVGLSLLASATARGENAAFVDLGDGLDPENAAAAGVDLGRIFWIRPERIRDAAYAAEVVLAAGFPLVVVDLGLLPAGKRVPESAWVRLARSTRTHGAVLLLTSPYPMAGVAADAAIHLERERAVWSGGGASPRLLVDLSTRFTVEKMRGEKLRREAEARFSIHEAIGARVQSQK